MNRFSTGRDDILRCLFEGVAIVRVLGPLGDQFLEVLFVDFGVGRVFVIVVRF